MAQPNGNLVSTPQSGFVSTNPFLKANLSTPNLANAKPVTPTFGASANATGANGNPYASNTTLPGTTANSGSTTPGIIPIPNVSSSGVVQPQGNGLGITSSTPAQTTAYTLNGVNYNSAGDPISKTTAPVSGGNTGNGTTGGGGTITPANNQSNIQSQINTDQSAVAALQQQLAAQNTYSGGINSSGQTLPGYVSPNSLGSAVSTLANTSGTSSPQYQAAQAQYDAANAQLQALKSSTAYQGLLGAGTNESEYLGTQGLLNTGLTNSINSLTGEMSAAQSSAQVATGQQTTQQSGQGAVVSALQPQSQYGALVNPATGQPISSSALVSGASSLPAIAQSALSALPQTAQSAIMLEAQKVQNNQETLAQAQSNLGSYGQAGNTALNAILGPSFNANTNSGASAAQQSNVSTAGTASVQANQQIYTQQLSAAATTLQQAQAIQSSGSQLLTTMTSLGINPTDANVANKTINQLASQYSSAAYATFNANIANLQSKVSALLSAGEIPTGATAAANSIIDGSMSMSGLNAAITQINTEASQLAQSQLSTAQSAYQNLTNGSNGTTNTSAPSPYH